MLLIKRNKLTKSRPVKKIEKKENDFKDLDL